MSVRLVITLPLATLTLLSAGCFHDETSSDETSNQPAPTTETGSSDVQAAIARLRAAANQQLQAVRQAYQATSATQISQAVTQQRAAQQRAAQPEQTLQDAGNRQALADYYAARTRSNERMTQILREQAEARRVEEQRLQQQRLQAQYEAQRQERQRLERLYEQQRAEARRQADQAAGYP